MEKNLDITVQHDRNMYKIILPEYSTVEDLKLQIVSRTKVPVNQQLLSGWKNQSHVCINLKVVDNYKITLIINFFIFFFQTERGTHYKYVSFKEYS